MSYYSKRISILEENIKTHENIKNQLTEEITKLNERLEITELDIQILKSTLSDLTWINKSISQTSSSPSPKSTC